MAGSLTYSSKGGAVSAISPGFETPYLAQTLTTGQKISILGTDPDGKAPETQGISIQSTTALTLPAIAFTGSTPFKKGQRVTIFNVGAQPITFPTGAFNPGSRAEVLDASTMIEIIFMNPIGWIPCDDDESKTQLPVTFWNGADNFPGNARVLLHDKGVLLKKGNLAGEPVARLETSSFAVAAKTVGANWPIGYEEHTIVLGGGGAATFTLPNPALCPGREVRIVSENGVITLVVTGGSSVLVGQNTVITTVAARGGLTIQSINGVWRKVGGF